MVLLAKRMPIEEVIKTTGFRTREAGLLEQVVRLYSHFETGRIDKDSMIIGGFAARLYISTKYKGKLSHDEKIDCEPTDVDVIFNGMPSEFRSLLVEERWVERREKRTPLLGGGERVVPALMSEYSSYHLRPEVRTQPGMQILDNACFFDRKVGRVIVREEDLQRARLLDVYIGNGEQRLDGTIRVAEPGFLLATVINPIASTPKRSWRAVLVLASLSPHEREEAIERYVETVKISRFTLEELEGSLKTLQQEGNRKNFFEVVGKFISEVQQRMAPMVALPG